jgi:hypothetical protein
MHCLYIISYMVCSWSNMVYTWSVNSIWGSSSALAPYGIYWTWINHIGSTKNHVTNISYRLTPPPALFFKKYFPFCEETVENALWSNNNMTSQIRLCVCLFIAAWAIFQLSGSQISDVITVKMLTYNVFTFHVSPTSVPSSQLIKPFVVKPTWRLEGKDNL